MAKDDQLPISIAIVTIYHAHSRTVEIVLAPRPQEHTSVRTIFFQLNAELFVRLHPLSDSIQNAWKHSFENDRLKQMNDQTCDKVSTQKFRRTYGTTQNFIARPGNADIHPVSRQDKWLPQTFNQFVTPTQLEHINEGRNFGEHKKLRDCVSGSIGNQVFSERILLSRTTKGARKILSCCLSSSSSVRGLPSKPRTRHPGVSRRRRLSPAKCRILESAVGPLNCHG